MNGMLSAGWREASEPQTSAALVAEREAIEAAWYRRTNAEDVLNELLIDHEDALNELFKEDDALAIGRYVQAVRKALSLRYVKHMGDDFPPYRSAR
jgi:hypothetical protein